MSGRILCHRQTNFDTQQKRKARMERGTKGKKRGRRESKANKKNQEMDEDYVHYASSDDDILPTTNSSLPDKDKDDDSNDDDDDDFDMMEDKEAEIGLGNTKEGESDVEVTLDFYDPRKEDEGSICNFLEKWTQRLSIQESKDNFGKVICSQSRVGTTVRVEDDEAPVGFITCLNIRRHSELLKSFFKTLRKKDKDREKDGGGQFTKVLNTCIDGEGRFENEKMGLILTERVINMPPPVVPKLLEAIFCEIGWAVEDEPTKELREEYRFGWYLYITEMYTGSDKIDDDKMQQVVVDDESSTGEKEKKKKKKKKKKKEKKPRIDQKTESTTTTTNFMKIEDEAWFKYASHKLTWPIAASEEVSQKDNVGRTAVAMIITAKNVQNVRSMVEEAVGNVKEKEEDVDEEKEEDEMET